MGKAGKRTKQEINCLEEEFKKYKGLYSEIVTSFREVLQNENEESKEKLVLFDDVKKENEDLKNKIQVLENENEIMKSKPSFCNVACDTSDLIEKENDSKPLDVSCSINELQCHVDMLFDKCDFAEVVEVCKNEDVFESTSARNKKENVLENNVGLKTMKIMGYNGNCLGKYEQGMKEPIESVMRPKFQSLGYGKTNNINVSVATISRKEIECMECFHCHRRGNRKEKCWDLHPCSICGLKNHFESSCWKRDCGRTFTKDCMQIDLRMG